MPELRKILIFLYHLHQGEADDLETQEQDLLHYDNEEQYEQLSVLIVTDQQRDQLAEQFGLLPSGVDEEVRSVAEELLRGEGNSE